MSSLGNFNYDYLFKYIIIGDPFVGKSNLLLKFCFDKFNEEYQVTIGVEFGTKVIQLENQEIKIQIWDTAGAENFRSITRSYYKNTVCALVVYDISNRETFMKVTDWIEDCKSQAPKSLNIILVGNKKDLSDKREVSFEEGQDLAEKNKIPFYETSAKTGENVENVFIKSANEILKKINENYYDLDKEDCGIKIGHNHKASKKIELNNDEVNSKQKEKGGCC